MSPEVLVAIGGVISTILGALGATRLERHRVRQAEKSAEEQANDSIWKRSRDLMAGMQEELRSVKGELAKTDAALAAEQAARIIQEEGCLKRIKDVRAEGERDNEALVAKVKVLSGICVEQQLEIDRTVIKMSKMEREMAMTIPGGRRVGDPPGPQTDPTIPT